MKVGILGSGFVVSLFLEAATKLEEMKLVAICGHHNVEKTEKIASENHIPFVYFNYQEMLDNPKVDTIYIGTPNNLHYEQAKQALLNHKNVILEKPFTRSFKQAEELVELAKRNKLFLFEAITVVNTPNFEKTKELVDNFEKIKIVELNYVQYSSRYDNFKKGIIHPVFDYQKEGGSLRDLGVYNVHFVVGLFGEPLKYQYYPNIERNVDVSGTLIMTYDHFSCILVSAKDCSNYFDIRIQGDKKCIHSTSAIDLYDAFTFVDEGKEETYALNVHQEMFYSELSNFISIYASKDYEKCYQKLQNSLIVIKIIENVYKEMNAMLGLEIDQTGVSANG